LKTRKDPSPTTPDADALHDVVRTQTQIKRQLRELQALGRQTDAERDEAWRLLGALQSLTTEARRLRLGLGRGRRATNSPVSRSGAAANAYQT
jgi:hypothetical protein